MNRRGRCLCIYCNSGKKESNNRGKSLNKKGVELIVLKKSGCGVGRGWKCIYNNGIMFAPRDAAVFLFSSLLSAHQTPTISPQLVRNLQSFSAQIAPQKFMHACIFRKVAQLDGGRKLLRFLVP